MKASIFILYVVYKFRYTIWYSFSILPISIRVCVQTKGFCFLPSLLFAPIVFLCSSFFALTHTDFSMIFYLHCCRSLTINSFSLFISHPVDNWIIKRFSIRKLTNYDCISTYAKRRSRVTTFTDELVGAKKVHQQRPMQSEQEIQKKMETSREPTGEITEFEDVKYEQ